MSFVDSICIKFLNPTLIIYGKGNQLFLIQNNETKKVEKLKLTRDKIHRISYLQTDDNTFLIACVAAREIFITKIKNSSFQRDFQIKRKFSDWIMNIQYLRDETIAIITAHNMALLLKVNENQLIIEEKLICEDNSTLYCSIIHGNNWNDLIFFSGTALGRLIIWKCTRDNDTKIIYQNSLHNGVIFCIDYNENYIVTGSDDRSIKVFKTNEDLSELYEQKQLFGHTSRVFVGRVIRYKNQIKFISTGEDANLCLWTEDGSLQIKKNVGASGCIWNLDYEETTKTIITSSATGKLNKFELDKIFFKEYNNEEITTFDNVQPIKIVYLNNVVLCLLDSNMQIFTKFENEWRFVNKLFHKIVAMDSYENRLFLIAKNSITTFDFCDKSNKLNFKSDINIKAKCSIANEKKFYFRAIHILNRYEVFISDMHGHCFVVDVENEKLLNLFQIPNASNNEKWTTAATKFNESFFIVGDRGGSLLLYKNRDDLTTFHQPIFKISKLHCQFGFNVIKILKNNFFSTAGIGGMIKTLFFNEKLETIEVYQTEKTPINSVQKIIEYNGVEYMLGFNDNYFVMTKRNEIIYEHRCGGKHRHWDVTFLNKDDCKMRFTYTHKKHISSVEFYADDFVFNTFTGNNDDAFWHLKGCNAIKMIDDAMILISCGEDTFLKLTQMKIMEDGDISFRSIANINSHISSIKALTTFTKDNDLFIISVGGRAQLILTRVIKKKYVQEKINFMLTDYLLNGTRNEREKDKILTFDPETRFTCVHFDEKTNNVFIGCSDGYIRIFKIIDEFTSLKLIIESFYGRCILKLTSINGFLVSMATDGIVCFWSFDETQNSMIIVNKIQHNQNGINCFDAYTSGNSYKIATAGDDCGICVTAFEIINDCLKFYKTIRSYDVHIAQVTGVKFLSHNQILSVGIDQMVCKLKIDNDKIEIIDEKFTCISDVKGFALFRENFILIHGAGLEKLDYF
ncbi:hypothetical protein PVAND_004363 [Polypedilum vanderplanki]|uniref:tRNA (34-2'-O)-methyltransferase regulator WDR6 n=1 Tax=Polypedilum vanderplanki TaxID=319348 RepID=A0A9J6BXX9_POLVA|nr:hypothetical protein PVAND_004363 [Polypedilum vanderplanki]